MRFKFKKKVLAYISKILKTAILQLFNPFNARLFEAFSLTSKLYAEQRFRKPRFRSKMAEHVTMTPLLADQSKPLIFFNKIEHTLKVPESVLTIYSELQEI